MKQLRKKNWRLHKNIAKDEKIYDGKTFSTFFVTDGYFR